MINENFSVTFGKLFGGGQAFMRLTDEENSAESGIDIVASPPGKKLQNILLLSGGEKALTALSLLVGIFQFQPARSACWTKWMRRWMRPMWAGLPTC